MVTTMSWILYERIKGPLRKTLKLTFWIQLFSQPRSATLRNQAVQVDERILNEEFRKLVRIHLSKDNLIRDLTSLLSDNDKMMAWNNLSGI